MSLGQAAGTAAAMAIDAGTALRNLDGTALKAQLIQDGCGLDHAPDGFWKSVRESKKEPVILMDMAIIMP